MSSSPAVPILMYHKVAPVQRASRVPGHYVPPRLFSRQMDALASRGYQTVRLSDLFRPGVPLPERPIAITFDDGYENFLTQALPVLVRHGFTATVFLVANCLGKTNRWDTEHGDVEERLMDLGQIRRAAEVGTEFGSHTLDHVDLAAVDEREAWRQINDSRKALQDALCGDVDTFCYPYGRKTPEVSRMVERAGYRLACSTEKGINTEGTDPYALKRINVRRDTYVPVLLHKLRRDAGRIAGGRLG